MRSELSAAFALALGGCGPSLAAPAVDAGPQLELAGPLAFAPGHAEVVPTYAGDRLRMTIVARDDAGSCLGDGDRALFIELRSTSGARLAPGRYALDDADAGALSFVWSELDGEHAMLLARSGRLALDAIDTAEGTHGAGNRGRFEAAFLLLDAGTAELSGAFDLSRPECR